MPRIVSKPTNKSRCECVLTVNLRHISKKFRIHSVFCKLLNKERERELPVV